MLSLAEGEQFLMLQPDDFGTTGYAERRAEAIGEHFESMLPPDRGELLWLFDYWIEGSAPLRDYLWAHDPFDVKKKRFSVEQIVGVLKQAEVGVPIGELVRQVGISEQTFYRWKKRYAKLEIDQLRQLKQLQEENHRLQRLVAELTLDKTMLQDVLAKKF